jgi:hypothetical protein
MIEPPENAQLAQGTHRTAVTMAVIAVMISLFPLLFACSSEGSKDQSDGGRRTEEGQRDSATRGGQAGDDSKGASRAETQAAIVPIAHLSSIAENISTQELSGTRNVAVGRGYHDEAEELLDSPRFESFDSGDAVVEHVSNTPEALGLVPWDEVGPRVKALSVDGRSLLDSEGSGDYPLRPEGATVPDPQELRRVVVGGGDRFPARRGLRRRNESRAGTERILGDGDHPPVHGQAHWESGRGQGLPVGRRPYAC